MAKFNLQYTLLLLILKALIYSTYIQLQFTIHFATINTRSSPEQVTKQHSFTIHFATINTISNSPYDFKIVQFTIHFATINTSLRTLSTSLAISFTIHFATINTKIIWQEELKPMHLQYTLLLLIQFKPISFFSSYLIYNTLCYY